MQKELSGGHCAGEPRAFRPKKTPFKWSFLVRKARRPPVTRSFGHRPRLHFPVDLSSAQHHAQAPKIAHTLPTQPIIPNCGCLVVGSVGQPHTVCDTRCHLMVACCGKQRNPYLSKSNVWFLSEFQIEGERCPPPFERSRNR